MLKVEFSPGGDMRMGSPHMISHIRLSGDEWVPEFLMKIVFAENILAQGNGLTALIAWDDPLTNGPAFRVVIIDENDRKVFRSARIEDGPEKVTLIGDRRVRVDLYRYIIDPKAIEVDVQEEYLPEFEAHLPMPTEFPPRYHPPKETEPERKRSLFGRLMSCFRRG